MNSTWCGTVRSARQPERESIIMPIMFNLDESCEVVMLESRKGSGSVQVPIALAHKMARCVRAAMAEGIAKVDPTLAQPQQEQPNA